MTAAIVLVCDQAWAEGMCPYRETYDATTIDQAREAARARGWATLPRDRDLCPNHSGRRP